MSRCGTWCCPITTVTNGVFSQVTCSAQGAWPGPHYNGLPVHISVIRHRPISSARPGLAAHETSFLAALDRAAAIIAHSFYLKIQLLEGKVEMTKDEYLSKELETITREKIRDQNNLENQLESYLQRKKTMIAREARLKSLHAAGEPLVFAPKQYRRSRRFHSAERPCGRAPSWWDRDHYEDMMLSEALDQRIEPCRHCGRQLLPRKAT
jgi:hypothetical protein